MPDSQKVKDSPASAPEDVNHFTTWNSPVILAQRFLVEDGYANKNDERYQGPDPKDITSTIAAARTLRACETLKMQTLFFDEFDGKPAGVVEQLAGKTPDSTLTVDHAGAKWQVIEASGPYIDAGRQMSESDLSYSSRIALIKIADHSDMSLS